MSDEVVPRQYGVSSVKSRKSSFHWKITDMSRLEMKLYNLFSDSPVKYYDDEEYFDDTDIKIKDVIESPIFSTNPSDLKWSLVIVCIKGDCLYYADLNHPALSFEFRSKDIRYFELDVNLEI